MVGDSDKAGAAAILRYDLARVLLSGAPAVLRSLLRSVLHGIGFRDFHDTPNLAGARDELRGRRYDLWITHAPLDDGDPFDLIRQIRHRGGHNQFVPIIVMGAEVTETIARRALDSGADLLWRLPITGGQIMSGIRWLTHERKPFVVTADYVGPDRRGQPREGVMQVPLLDVPNPLAQRAVGAVSKLNAEEAARAVNEQKVERYVYQLRWLVNRAVPRLLSDPASEAALGQLGQILDFAKDLFWHLGATRWVHQAELCRALLKVVGETRQNPTRKNLALLQQTTMAVAEAFEILGDKEAELALQIAHSINAA